MDRKDEYFIKPSGEHIALSDIKQHISNTLSGLYSLGGKPDVAMIEQLVEFDPIFDKYSFEGVPDIRIILYKGYPAMAMLRCSTKESDGKANLHQGAVGVGIDMATGKALYAVQHNHPIQKHPNTGHDFSELKIPHWEDMLALSALCYDVTQLGYMGVDIVLDKNLGPLILELNARPGLAIQIANQTGALIRFDAIDKEPMHLTVEERVKFTMKNFRAADEKVRNNTIGNTTGNIKNSHYKNNVGKTITFDSINEKDQKIHYKAKVEEVSLVRNAQGKEYRYIIKLTLTYKNVVKYGYVNLRTRTKMTYKLLIGRNWLNDDFYVITDRKTLE